MFLKVVCQLCGKTETIDTKKPTEWFFDRLGNFGVNGTWEDYDIWICPKCKVKHMELDEIDFDRLGEAIRESLGVEGE